ncbi:hypothetical protein Tco_1236169 [Tanacetum coccineum]
MKTYIINLILQSLNKRRYGIRVADVLNNVLELFMMVFIYVGRSMSMWVLASICHRKICSHVGLMKNLLDRVCAVALAILITGASQSRQHGKSEPVIVDKEILRDDLTASMISNQQERTNAEKSKEVSMSSSNEVRVRVFGLLEPIILGNLLVSGLFHHCYPCQTLDPVALLSHELCDLAPLHEQTCQNAYVEIGRHL